MTPQLVDHAHTHSCVVIGCSLAENEHVYFWLQSHRSWIAEKRDQTGECPKQAKKNTRIARQTNPDRQIDAYTDCAARSTNTVISQRLGRAGDRTNLAACICTETNHYGVLGLYLHDRFMHSNCEPGTQFDPYVCTSFRLDSQPEIGMRARQCFTTRTTQQMLDPALSN